MDENLNIDKTQFEENMDLLESISIWLDIFIR